ncbi:PilZ domain-containing protein [Thiosocius teredinicola]|uniref:PilZ domain-containing protein n=1 Tax=Thiosocius teredinicola TaxID=1973002 RepID=UPI000990EE47
MIDYSEKRNFIRMPMNCPISMLTTGKDEADYGQLLDLSASGMRFISPRELDRGDRLQIGVRPMRPITPPLEAEIEVVRCTERSDGFDIAASIVELQPPAYDDTNTLPI